MRSKILALILSLFVCTPAAIVAGGNIEWIETQHSFGDILESDGKVAHRFLMVNTGDDDVVIKHVRPSCGCSATDYPRRPISPGDTAAITATFNPAGRPGDFDTFFTVITNTQPDRTVLKLSGRVIANAPTVNEQYPVSVGSLKLNAASVPFGEISENETPRATTEAYNDSDVPLKIYTDGNPDYVGISIGSDTIAPHGLMPITVTFDARKCNRRGLVETDFSLFAEPVSPTSSALAGIKRISVMATVLDDFAGWSEKQLANAPVLHLDTDRVAFADIDTLAGKTLTRQLAISNAGNDTLRIYGIRPAERYIDIGPFKSDLGKGESTTVGITIFPDKITEDIINTYIIIYCNDPRQAIMAVRIVGNKK